MATSTCTVRIFHLKGFDFIVSKARVIFEAGKNRDGWFSCEDLLQQTDMAIDIFEGKTNGFVQGLFLFDNAPSHQKRAPNALYARKIPKGPHPTWTLHKEGLKMCMTQFASGEDQLERIQDLYFNHNHPTMPGWFKGMEIIIRKRGLWPENGMIAQCDGFKCVAGETNCCSRCLLFTQPDFIAQKSHLEELITSCSHICNFYPKYHCKLNFIEQYWGAAKLCYWNSPKTADINEIEANMKACLDAVPLVQIQRCVIFSFILVTQLISTYFEICKSISSLY